jgi:hypothetical protein
MNSARKIDEAELSAVTFPENPHRQVALHR